MTTTKNEGCSECIHKDFQLQATPEAGCKIGNAETARIWWAKHGHLPRSAGLSPTDCCEKSELTQKLDRLLQAADELLKRVS